MQHSLGSVPGWQEAASSQSSSPSTGARCDGFCSGVQVWQALAGLSVLRCRGGWRTGAMRRNVNGGSRKGACFVAMQEQAANSSGLHR